MRRYLVVLPVLLLPTLSFGNENLKTLANGLGISEGQARTCLQTHVTPGEQPTQAQRRAVYVCFKSHNPEPSQVRAAMAAAQP